MKIDLLLDPFGATWPALLDMAEAAESLGFDGLWTWDHLAGEVHGERSVLECWTVLSALAARTTRVTLGPLVLNVANRRPGVLAVMAATLQTVASGRLILGLGAGGDHQTPYWREQAALGLDVPGDRERRQQVADAVTICRAVWTGRTDPTELVTQSLGAGAGFQRPDPPPPIIVGGFGPRMAELAGSVADGFNTQAGHPHLAQLVDIARTAHANRPPSTTAGTAATELAAAPFEISGFAGLDPRLVSSTSGHLDRLVMIVSPDNGIEPISRFAAATGLAGR